MTLYLIGLGLNLNSLTIEALETIKKCKKIYLENYTVDFPYKLEELEKNIKTKIIHLSREETENETIVEEAKKQKVALLVYGDALSATTHMQLIIAAKKQKIPFKIFHNASVLTAIAETGLQLYKFGKTASMPKWNENWKPESFAEIIQENQKIKAHTLILTDIGLTSKESINQLKKVMQKRKTKIEKIIICSQVGTPNSKIYYDSQDKLSEKQISHPFCIIIPCELHFIEQEALELLKEK